MWSALENIALRESLPLPLEAGDSVHDVLIAGQLDRGKNHLHHLGRRRSRPYLIKQFYSVDTDAFLRWQNETRFIDLPETPGYVWPCEEWRGGVISPFPDGVDLVRWLEDNDPSPHVRLAAAVRIAALVARLHRSGIIHRALSPTSVLTSGLSVLLTDFGFSRCEGWDDFWSDATPSTCDPNYASPELLRGSHCGTAEDVYAFGALLHLLLTGHDAFSALRQRLRPLFPGYVTPSPISQHVPIPPSVRELASACTAPRCAQRPTMDEVATLLAETGQVPLPDLDPIPVPRPTASPRRRQRIMVFVKDDDRAIPLFEAALARATQTPAMLLFIGLVPHHLPSGHLERFKGTLFKKMRQGLMQTRAAGHPWSLRVFDNTDPERAALELVRLYRPDHILVGASQHGGARSLRHGFQTTLAESNHVVEPV